MTSKHNIAFPVDSHHVPPVFQQDCHLAGILQTSHFQTRPQNNIFSYPVSHISGFFPPFSQRFLINFPRLFHQLSEDFSQFSNFPKFSHQFPRGFPPFLSISPPHLHGSSPACSLGGGGFGASGVTGGSTLGTAPGAISRRCSKASTMPPAFCSKKLAISTWIFWAGRISWAMGFWVWGMIYGWIYGVCYGDVFISLLWFDYDLADKNIEDITQLNTIGKLAISTCKFPQLRNRCHLPSTSSDAEPQLFPSFPIQMAHFSTPHRG